jgi:hypothetical protein
MTRNLPAWARQTATPQDRARAEQARRNDTIGITWPAIRALRRWAKQQGWPTPWFGIEEAFVDKMMESEETFALAVEQSGVVILIPIPHFAVSQEQLRGFDQWYAARSPEGRPTEWGILVEALRDIRRAVEAGVEVEIDGKTIQDFGSFYTWAHERYHMLEDGYDRWIGDDRG